MRKRAVTKTVRVSPFKAREITRLIQGKTVEEALALVDFAPQKAAGIIGKTLRSAIANAVNSGDGVEESDLTVAEAIVGEGPTMKRLRTKARGMAGRIRKRTSHIRVVVTDE
jgi:large subunit ribosomal protein L22